jgi:hypothetical protein
MKRTFVILTLAIVYGSLAIAQDDASPEEDDASAAASPSGPAAEVAQPVSPLHDLEWMVGKWIDQGDETTITTECSWKHAGKFLARSFKITTSGMVTLEGTQVIGWDPIEGQIRSWTFDSEGGIGSGRWIRDGNRWLVKTSFTLASGERASAINIITFVNQDTLQWQSTNREIAGELQPSIPEVTVVRQKSVEDVTKQSQQEDSQ